MHVSSGIAHRSERDVVYKGRTILESSHDAILTGSYLGYLIPKNAIVIPNVWYVESAANRKSGCRLTVRYQGCRART